LTIPPASEGLYRRSDLIARPGLRETYLHLTNRCKTTCRYCYCSASPLEDPTELSTERWMQVIDRLADLGVSNFVFIGGDPFLRRDILDLVEYVTRTHGRKLRIFYNGYLSPELASELAARSEGSVVMVASLEGASQEINDAIRGRGNHVSSVEGLRNTIGAGLATVVNTVVTTASMDRLVDMLRFLEDLNVTRWHLLLPYRSGYMRRNPSLIPTDGQLSDAVLTIKEPAQDSTVYVDNFAAWKVRLNGRYDFCNAGYDLITVGHDGTVYPCQLMVGHQAFKAGSVLEQEIEDIWLNSPVMQAVRDASFTGNPKCQACELRETCGGECMVQSYYAREALQGAGSLTADYPYCALTKSVLARLADDLAPQKTDGLKYIECT